MKGGSLKSWTRMRSKMLSQLQQDTLGMRLPLLGSVQCQPSSKTTQEHCDTNSKESALSCQRALPDKHFCCHFLIIAQRCRANSGNGMWRRSRCPLCMQPTSVSRCETSFKRLSSNTSQCMCSNGGSPSCFW